jgi:hypothetical protein
MAPRVSLWVITVRALVWVLLLATLIWIGNQSETLYAQQLSRRLLAALVWMLEQKRKKQGDAVLHNSLNAWVQGLWAEETVVLRAQVVRVRVVRVREAQVRVLMVQAQAVQVRVQVRAQGMTAAGMTVLPTYVSDPRRISKAATFILHRTRRD